MKTLLEKFKARVAEIDSPALPREPEAPAKPVKLFNIFKRSLPPIHNKLAFQNVTEADVNFLFQNILKPRKLANDSVVYWDALPVGQVDAWNIYSNEGIKLVVTEGEDGRDL